MKKYIIGTLFGFALAFSITAHGEAINLIDKVVQGMFPVTVDGVSMGEAIVVDSKTYLPVRSFGEAIGYDVKFDADMGVTLTKNVGGNLQNTQPTTQTDSPSKIKEGHKQISKVTINIDSNPIVKNDGQFGIIEVDGEQYVSLTTISKPYDVTWKKPIAEVILNKEIIKDFTVNETYTTGVDAFNYQGTSYIKLSLLGLKATATDGTLIIEKQ